MKKLVMHLKSIVILDYFIKFTTSIVVRRQIVKRIFFVTEELPRTLTTIHQRWSKEAKLFL